MPIFQVTERILTSAKDGNMDGMALRLAPHRNPDGSIEYNKMGFDNIKDGDVHIHTEGIDVVFEPAHKELLEGTTMDFVEIEDGNPSFIFLNPNDPNFVPPKKQ